MDDSCAVARKLVLAYGWNATAYQILNPGIWHWHAPEAPAVVGYVPTRAMQLVAGAPVCPPERLAETMGRFEEDAGRGVCYFGAGERLRDTAEGLGRYTSVAFGAQPVWDPHGWDELARTHAGVRAQIRRAANKGVGLGVWAPEQARQDAGLRGVLNAWLASRPMPTLHFMTEPEVLDGVLADRVIIVALQRERPVAFLVASPVPKRNGYLLEQIARRPDAPNGTAELLIDTAMRLLAQRGCTYATLGMVALAEHAKQAMQENPLWLRVLLGWARAHGRRFYNFDGLEAFRTKLCPDRWEMLYAVTNRPRFTPGMLVATARAFWQASPWRIGAGLVVRAIGQELSWAAAPVKRRLSA